VKAQGVRVLDVVVIGPVMIAGGWALAGRRPVLGPLLVAMGFGTIVYNARNWVAVSDRQRGALALPGAVEVVEIEEA